MFVISLAAMIGVPWSYLEVLPLSKLLQLHSGQAVEAVFYWNDWGIDLNLNDRSGHVLRRFLLPPKRTQLSYYHPMLTLPGSVVSERRSEI